MKDREPSNVVMAGETICVLHAGAEIIEAWVKKVAERSGQQVDWGFSCGYAGVSYIGDRSKVLAAISELKPELDEAASAENLRLYGRASLPPFRIY